MAYYKLYWIALFFFLSTTSKAVTSKIENYIFQDQSHTAVKYIDSLLRAKPSLSIHKKAQLLLWKAEAFYQADRYEDFYETTLTADSLFNISEEISKADSLLYLLNYARYYHYLINAKKAHSYGKIARRIFYELPKNEFLKYAHHTFHTLGSYYRNSVRINNKSGNRDTSLMYLDSALYYHELYFGQPNYYKAIIHRSKGNYLIDRVKKNRAEERMAALNHYDSALEILRKNYPENISDPAKILSLKGLNYLYGMQLDSARLYFEKVNKMLEKEMVDDGAISKYASTYLTNIEWYRNYLERSEKFNDTVFLKTYLEKLNRAEDIYLKYSSLNLNLRCKCLLDIYRKTPYPSLISVNYRLWELTKNKEYLNLSLQLTDRANHVAFQQFVMESSGAKNQKIEFFKMNVAKIQKQLKADEAYLLYYDATDLSDYNFYAFLITKDQLHSQKINYKTTGIPKVAFWTVLNKKSDKKFNSITAFKKHHYTLYELLFRDFEKEMHGRINTLKIVANNSLSKVNFEILLTDTTHHDYRKLNYLIKDYKIAYAASLQRLISNKRYKGKATDKKVFISPIYKDRNLINLENLNQNIREWASLLSAEVLLNDSLSVKKIDQSFQNASFVHLNGHVAHLPGNEIVHYLNDKKQNQAAHFKLQDAFNTKLENAFVIHTACQSGKGKPDRNALPISFARAFHFVGAESVIYSKYPADENATIRLFEEFYQKIAAKIPPFNALHQSKLHFLKTAQSSEAANPYYWSTYQWLGSTETEINIAHHILQPHYILIAGISLLFIPFFFIAYRKFFG